MIVSRTGGANRSPAALRRPASFVSEVLESRLLLHAGDADSGFGNNGVVFPADVNFSADTSAGATVFTGDGKLIVAGAISDPALRMPHTSTGLCVARYNADGTLDHTFDGDGISVLDTPEATEVSAAAMQPDGKVVVAGRLFYSFTGEQLLFARLNPDGSPDTTFGGKGFVTTPCVDPIKGSDRNSFLRDLEILPNGQIMAAGGRNWMWVARLNPDGSFDPAFGQGGQVGVNISVTPEPYPDEDDFGYALAVQGDGKVVLVGTAVPNRTHPNDDHKSHGVLLRFDANGTLDPTFGVGGIVHATLPQGPHGLYAVQILPGGGIAAAGGRGRDFVLMHFNADGTPDTSFGAGGAVYTPAADPADPVSPFAEFAPDGKVVVAGPVVGEDGWNPAHEPVTVRRYLADGSPDGSFGVGGRAVASQASLPNFASDIAVAADGSVAVASGHAVVDASHLLYSLRLTPAGVPDAAYDGDGVVATHVVMPVAVQVDAVVETAGGKVVVAGKVYDSLYVARFNRDGSADASFADIGWRTYRPVGFYSVSALVEQPDGKLLIGCDTGTGFAMFRIDQAGDLDFAFGANVGAQTAFPGNVGADLVDVALQPDGKIVVGGDLRYSALEYRIGVARYNPDGTLDSSFSQDGTDVVDLGPGYEYARSVAVLRSGAIVVGANADNGFDRRWVLVGYRGDGTRSAGFGVGGVSRVRLRRPTDELGDLVAAPDGAFFAAGAVTSRTGTDPGVARFRPNGSVDLHWGAAGLAIVPIEPFSTVAVTDLAVRPDGKLVMAGSLDGRGDYAWAARLDVNGSADASFGDHGRSTVRFGSSDSVATRMALAGDGGVLLSGYVRNPYQPFVARLTGDAPGPAAAAVGSDLRRGSARRTAYNVLPA